MAPAEAQVPPPAVRGIPISPYASQLPPFAARRGFDLHDLQYLRSLAMEIISHMQIDPTLIHPTFMFLQRSLEEHVNSTPEYLPGPIMVEDIDVMWVTTWLTNNTDFTDVEILQARLDDPESPTKMFIFETQWPPTLVIDAHFLHMEAFGRMSTKRSVAGGKRLNKLKARGGFQDGFFDWTFGCYEFAVDFTERVIAIKHITGKEIDLPDHVTIMASHDIQANWDDFNAEVLQDALPPQKLWRFVEAAWKETKEGPWALEMYHGGRCRSFDEELMREHLDLMAELMADVPTVLPIAPPDLRHFWAHQPDICYAQAHESRARLLMTGQPRQVASEGPQAEAAVATAAAAAASGLRGDDGEEDHT